MKMVQAVTTKAEQKVAAWLMEQSGQLGQMTLREVASGAGVGQPTVIRLLKKAGFSGWNDFLHMVWKEKKLLDEKYEIQLPAALSCMQEDIAVIREMAQHLNLKAMKKLASVIKKAHLIDIYGTDNSAGAASELSGKTVIKKPKEEYSVWIRNLHWKWKVPVLISESAVAAPIFHFPMKSSLPSRKPR